MQVPHMMQSTHLQVTLSSVEVVQVSRTSSLAEKLDHLSDGTLIGRVELWYLREGIPFRALLGT